MRRSKYRKYEPLPYLKQMFPPRSKSLRHSSILLLFAIIGGLLLQRSDAQNSTESSLPNYNFHISLPPVADQSDALTLPDLPLYDRNNRYLQVRDSSQDWYDANILNQEQLKPSATNQTLASKLQNQGPQETTPSSSVTRKLDDKPLLLLDADKRILPDLKPKDVLLDDSMVPIPLL